MFSAAAHLPPLLAVVAPWLSTARVGLIVIGLGLWHWTQQLIARRAPVTPADGGAIADGVHQLTAGWHQRLQANPRRADALLLASSLIIDLLGLGLIASSVFGPTFRPFLGLMMLFALRQVCQALCPLPPPPGMIWRNPGFPTLLVTYGVSNDLFFSGHTAIAVFGAVTALWVYSLAGKIAPTADAWLAGLIR